MKQAYQESPLVTTEELHDPLESLVRLVAWQLLQAALEAEVTEYWQRPRYARSGFAGAFTHLGPRGRAGQGAARE